MDLKIALIPVTLATRMSARSRERWSADLIILIVGTDGGAWNMLGSLRFERDRWSRELSWLPQVGLSMIDLAQSRLAHCRRNSWSNAA